MNSEKLRLFRREKNLFARISVLLCMALGTAVIVLLLVPARALAQQMVKPAGPNSGETAKAAAHLATNSTASEYIIGPTDVLDVSVWKEPEISRTVTVRPDGKISLPLIGELQAAGQTPAALQATIKEKLATFITSPEVTILVHDVRSDSISVFGKVAKPGAYPLAKQMTIMDVLAAAGGFKDYAKTTKIYLLRVESDGTTKRYMFNFKQVIKGQNLSQNLLVEPHDTIYVP